MSTKVGRLLVRAAGPVDGVDEFYGTPPLTRVRDYSRDGVPLPAAALQYALRHPAVTAAVVGARSPEETPPS